MYRKNALINSMENAIPMKNVWANRRDPIVGVFVLPSNIPIRILKEVATHNTKSIVITEVRLIVIFNQSV
jgi:hypothetical protein